MSEHKRRYVPADETLIALWLSGRSRHTQAAYRESVDRLLAQSDKALAAHTMADLEAFATYLASALVHHGTRAGQPLAAASRARTFAAIKSLYAFGVQHGYLTTNPTGALRTPKGRDTLAERIISEGDMRRLIAAAAEPCDLALVRLLYGGGLRISEACGLRWSDVLRRSEGAQLAVFGKGGKNRYVLVAGNVMTALDALRGTTGDSTLVLAGLTPRAAWARIKGLANAAGLSEAISPHWLRHAHASHALDRNCPIHLLQASLGHASVATTSKYLHARPQDGSGRYLPE